MERPRRFLRLLRQSWAAEGVSKRLRYSLGSLIVLAWLLYLAAMVDLGGLGALIESKYPGAILTLAVLLTLVFLFTFGGACLAWVSDHWKWHRAKRQAYRQLRGVDLAITDDLMSLGMIMSPHPSGDLDVG